jgi:4-aminobutyrate--pyruvate transaminase
MNDRMFEPIADESNKIGVLGHGFTGGGHPVGAAVALENLKIIEERGLVAHAAETGAYLQARLRELSSHPLVGEVRGVGMIAAIELVLDKQRKTAAATPGAVGGIASRMLQERGVISRNMLDAIAICPPLIVNKAQIDELVGTLAGMLDDMKPEAAKLTPA